MIEIFTIGHSNHDVNSFISILRLHGVQVLMDLRSEPYSKYASQFNKRELQYEIESAGFEYRYSGASIGGKPKDTSLYTPAGKPDYDRLSSTAAFQNELKEVVKIAQTKRVALMCSEGNPVECHRERIIAPVLRSWGVKVTHIMPDGTVDQIAQQTLF